jgi:hypothetical protein
MLACLSLALGIISLVAFSAFVCDKVLTAVLRRVRHAKG